MSVNVVDRVDDWDERSFTDGYRTLNDLAEDGFSGVIRANGAELYMTKGVAIAVHQGTIADFENAPGTIYEAPSPALPVLAVMQQDNEGVRDEFYSEKTALHEVDETLSDGGFTGYIELSENVLSGDYYVVYHAGNSMSVGFVGESRRLIDDTEAFETADDEIGIFEVRPAKIEPLELPEPPEPEPEPESASESESESASEEQEETADTEETESKASESEAESSDSPGHSTVDSSTPDSRQDEPSPDTDDDEGTTGRERRDAAESTPTSERSQPTQRPVQKRSHERAQTQRVASRTPSQSPSSERDLETRAIPSLDPSRTQSPEESTAVTTSQQQTHVEPRGRTAETTVTETHEETDSRGEEAIDAGEQTTDSATVSELEAERDTLQEQRDELESELETLESTLEDVRAENEELETELEAVRDERDAMKDELSTLEEEIERLESEYGAARNVENRLTPNEALSGTDIFVRYRSKGDATLESVLEENASRQDVENNLRLEKHTQFDAENVAVSGHTFDEFLSETVEYKFVRWAVRELIFEIRETGHEKSLKELYDVLPRVDRAELEGSVEVIEVEDGEEVRMEESFDVVLRDRMGNPLLVANLNDSRQAATKGMMEQLITAAERVGHSSAEFSGAFFVTRSFFDPGALEIAGEATKSGFLKRDKRKSFVNLSRKRGYHLCLVEARNENFHVAVPEL